MILLDTSGLLAWIDQRQRMHEQVVEALADFQGPHLLSPFVLAEMDYLLGSRVGVSAQEAFLEEVERGAYRLVAYTANDVGRALDVMRRYAGLEIGLADASIVILAERYGCPSVLTLDERRFRTVVQLDGRPFQLLPADA